MAPKVVILVLAWNHKDYTLACLNSLKDLDYDNAEVVVIDNGSTDGTEAAVRQAHPWVHVLRLDKNFGFAEGNNRGMRWALDRGAGYVFLLNNDTKVDRLCVKELVSAAERHPEFGMLGPLAYAYDDPACLVGATYIFDWDKMRSRILLLDEAASRDRGDYFEADYVQGDAVLIKREVLEQIGLFDSRFFLYYEETDLCFRARAHGYVCGIWKHARFQRMESGTTSSWGPIKWHYMTRNALLFISKNTQRTDRRKYVVRFLRGKRWDIADYYLPKYFKSKDSLYLRNSLAVLRGCFDYFLGRFGEIRAPRQI